MDPLRTLIIQTPSWAHEKYAYNEEDKSELSRIVVCGRYKRGYYDEPFEAESLLPRSSCSAVRPASLIYDSLLVKLIILKKQIEEIVHFINRSKLENDYLREQNDLLVGDLSAKISETESEIASLNARITRFSNLTNEMDAKIYANRTSLTQLEEKEAQNSQAMEELKQRVSSLERENASLRRDNDELRDLERRIPDIVEQCLRKKRPPFDYYS